MSVNQSMDDRFNGSASANTGVSGLTKKLLHGREVHRGTILIGVMFALGAGWVLWESQIAGPKLAVASAEAPTDLNMTMGLQSMQIDAAVGTMRQTRQQRLFAPFVREEQRRELRGCALSRDPFYLEPKEAPKKLEVVLTPTPAPVVVAPPVEQLGLQSILTGAIPTAIIDGILVQEGQVIAEWKVVKILPKSVRLQWRDRTHVLKMP